jgi:hypothetical protein
VPCGSHCRKVEIKENKVPLDEKLKACHPRKRAGDIRFKGKKIEGEMLKTKA